MNPRSSLRQCQCFFFSNTVCLLPCFLLHDSSVARVSHDHTVVPESGQLQTVMFQPCIYKTVYFSYVLYRINFKDLFDDDEEMNEAVFFLNLQGKA